MSKKTIFIILIFTATVIFAQKSPQMGSYQKAEINNNKQVQSNTPLCGRPLLTEEKLTAAVENTRMNKPEIYQNMIYFRKNTILRKAQQDTLGSIDKFFVYNFEKTEYDEIRAKLLAIGDITTVWVDTTELGNQHVTQAEVDSILKALEDRTPTPSRDPNKGIVELDEEFFGAPPNLDGDNKTDFLITDIKDGWEPGEGFIAGFFSSNDQTTNTGSNQRDMLYIDSYPGIFNNGERDPFGPLPVLAHEYQHLIHFNHDKNEFTFVNEGLSEVAEVICGYPLRSPSRYLSNPDIPLFDWDNHSSNVLADYSRAALFTLYYLEQLGDDVLKKMVSNQSNGTAAFLEILQEKGVGYDFNQLFKNFTTANIINNKSIDPKLGYDYPLSLQPAPTYDHVTPNQEITGESIFGYAADYVKYSFGDSLKINFKSNSSSLQINAIKMGTDTTLEQVTINAPSDTTPVFYEVPELGQAVKSVIFVVSNLIADTRSFSYTSTGQQKAFYVDHIYDDGEPDAFSGNATFLGFGENQAGSGWAVKFIPEIENNQLVNAKILAAFSQEFGGATVPSDADKDFTFHIWEDDNGLPGTDIIEPFKISTNRTSFSSDFLTVDLNDYKEDLSNLDSVYVGFTEDSDDTVGTYIGMDNSTATNFTYAFFGPNFENPNQWAPMSQLTIGSQQISLEGWNMMIRATFAYSDPEPPQFAVGYFQNPVFSEQLDIFIVGSSRLSDDKLTATLTQDTVEQLLSLSPVPNTSNEILFDNNITLDSSGTFQVNVRGTTKYGFIEADTTFTFNAEFIKAMQGGFIASADTGMQFTIPEKSIEENLLVIAYKGNSNIFNEKIENSLSKDDRDVYTVSPVGTPLTTAATIRFRLTDEARDVSPEALTIAQWHNDEWIPLESNLTENGKFLEARTRKLGHFVVLRKDQFTDINSSTPELPEKFALHQNYPNPFNPKTQIAFDLPEASFVSIYIYNILGQRIKTLLNSHKQPGSYQVTWDGTNNANQQVSSGIYIYRLKTEKYSKARKMFFEK